MGMTIAYLSANDRHPVRGYMNGGKMSAVLTGIFSGCILSSYDPVLNRHLNQGYFRGGKNENL
jgi:hypothetical protein